MQLEKHDKNHVIVADFLLQEFDEFVFGKISLKTSYSGAGSGIRTHEPLRDRLLKPAPLTWLGDPRPLCFQGIILP
jgi:hypothetical protein